MESEPGRAVRAGMSLSSDFSCLHCHLPLLLLPSVLTAPAQMNPVGGVLNKPLVSVPAAQL